MTHQELNKLDKKLTKFVEEMVFEMGRPERRRAMALYISGLLLDGERKSVQPMAARLVQDPAEAGAMRQRLGDCVSLSPWSDDELLARLGRKVDRELPNIEAFVVDDTGVPKKGEASVGVCRQYSGTLGRVDNCQVAVSLHLAGNEGSACVGMRLYLSEAWAGDQTRRRACGIPKEIQFQTKWEIALSQLDKALAIGIRRHPVLADAGYGDATAFREGIEQRGLHYVVGVSGVPTLWRPGVVPEVPRARKAGRPPSRPQAKTAPVSVSDFALELKSNQFRKVVWRAGSKGKMSSHFYATRVYLAERRTKLPRPTLQPMWLLIESTGSEKRPFKYFVSNLPETTSLKRLVELAKLRWRVERDYQELKGEIGLDHFEGRSWRGFHHHVTLCAVAHGFLALHRALSPPALYALDAQSSPPPTAASLAPKNWLLSVMRAASQQTGPTQGAFEVLI